MEIPDVPSTLWPLLVVAAGSDRIALVGGAVRDLLLHHQHMDPWRGLVDLDLVIEDATALGMPAGMAQPEYPSPAWRLVKHLFASGDYVNVRGARPHGQYGTVELELELRPLALAEASTVMPIRLQLDVASARVETYPVPADKPVVHFGALEDDLARRDFTINAMAVDLATSTLLDPHGGEADLAARQLRFLHANSVKDDPTRLVRAARYASRLGFELAPESATQAARTLAAWPWPWRTGDSPEKAPAALGTRLSRELELLLVQENWRVALKLLQEWGGLSLLDPLLQADPLWTRRLRRATQLGLPLMVALIVSAEDPLALAERLQLPHHQRRILQQFSDLRRLLAQEVLRAGPGARAPWHWCQLLEMPSLSPEAVALALACDVTPRRPLLRWLLKWRHLGSYADSPGADGRRGAPGSRSRGRATPLPAAARGTGEGLGVCEKTA